MFKQCAHISDLIQVEYNHPSDIVEFLEVLFSARHKSGKGEINIQQSDIRGRIFNDLSAEVGVLDSPEVPILSIYHEWTPSLNPGLENVMPVLNVLKLRCYCCSSEVKDTIVVRIYYSRSETGSLE